MSDVTEDSNKDKGFQINTRGISCIPCRCKKQFYHKETKTITETDKTTTTTTTVVDKRNMKFGGNGRHQSPDDIFKTEENKQLGSVEICDTGWGSKIVTPEELEERVEKLETDVDEIKKDINIITSTKSKLD